MLSVLESYNEHENTFITRCKRRDDSPPAIYKVAFMFIIN